MKKVWKKFTNSKLFLYICNCKTVLFFNFKTIYIMKHQQDNKQPPPMPCCTVTYQLWLNQQKTSNNGKT